MKRILVSIYLTVLTLSSAAQTSPILNAIPIADVYDDGRNKLGETPFDLSSLKLSVRRIYLKKEGYETVVITFTKGIKTPSFPAYIESCIPCPVIVDTIGPYGALDYTIRLRKKIKEQEPRLMVAIDTPVIDMPPKALLGRVNGGRKNLDDKNINRTIGYIQNLGSALTNAIENAYIDVYFMPRREEKKTTLHMPKIIFKPVITSLHFDLKGDLVYHYTGPCIIKCIWKISDVSDPGKYLAEIPIETTVYRIGIYNDLILHHLIGESERDLLEIDTLYDFLKKVEQEYLSKSKVEIFPIKLPPLVLYTSTRDMLKGIRSSVVTIENEDGFGSGSIVSEDGHILTSYHVIEGEKDIYVRVGKDKYKAEVVKTNTDFDLALIKIVAAGLKPLTIGNSDSTDIGDEVFAAGTPLDKSLTQSISRGIISGYREFNGVSFIQTDVSINAGSSGGPLLNSKGEIIGIATFKAFGRGIEGIGFGIPSNVAVEMLNIKFEK